MAHFSFSFPHSFSLQTVVTFSSDVTHWIELSLCAPVREFVCVQRNGVIRQSRLLRSGGLMRCLILLLSSAQWLFVMSHVRVFELLLLLHLMTKRREENQKCTQCKVNQRWIEMPVQCSMQRLCVLMQTEPPERKKD